MPNLIVRKSSKIWHFFDLVILIYMLKLILVLVFTKAENIKRTTGRKYGKNK